MTATEACGSEPKRAAVRREGATGEHEAILCRQTGKIYWRSELSDLDERPRTSAPATALSDPRQPHSLLIRAREADPLDPAGKAPIPAKPR